MESYDIIIIGAGVTGLAAGMYGGRLGLRTLIIGTNSSNELPIGGVITLTEVVENYPGFIRLTGPELAENIRKHALDYKDKVSIEEDLVNDIKKHGDCFTVTTKSGKSYISKTILFATGTKWRKLPMKGALKYESKGVHYCALCDSGIFRNKIVAVIGGSDSAAKEALLLSEHVKKVYMIYRGEKIRPEPINEERIKRNKKITVITRTSIIEIKGDKFVTHIMLDNKYNNSNIIKLDGVFGAIGSDPLSDLAKKLNVKINNKNEIIINHATSETNIKGVFAAGDVADKEFKQAITGVAEGVTATYSAYKYINENALICLTEDEPKLREDKISLVVSAIIIKNNKILLIKRSREPFKNYWSFISGQGAFKHTKNPMEAVKLEVKYDLNCKFNCEFFTHSYTDFDVSVINLFFIGKINGTPKINNKYVKEFRYFSLNEISKLKLAFDHKEVIKKLRKK